MPPFWLLCKVSLYWMSLLWASELVKKWRKIYLCHVENFWFKLHLETEGLWVMPWPSRPPPFIAAPVKLFPSVSSFGGAATSVRTTNVRITESELRERTTFYTLLCYYQWDSVTHHMAVPVPSISCCVLNHHNLFYHIHNALAFNRDMCCHLALCLWLLPFHWLLNFDIKVQKTAQMWHQG